MIKRQNELNVTAEYNANGEEKMYLMDLSDFKGKNEKVRMFSHILKAFLTHSLTTCP